MQHGNSLSMRLIGHHSGDVLFENCIGCDLGFGATSKDFDLTDKLLQGYAPERMTVLAIVTAIYGGGGFHSLYQGFFLRVLEAPPILLEMHSGDNQTENVNTPLREPLVVRFIRLGQPYYGSAAAFWSVIQVPPGAVGYRLEPSITAINTAERTGMVSTRFTPGNQEGEYKIRAVCPAAHHCNNGQGDSVTFTVHAIKELKLEGVSSAHQSGPVGTPLPQPFAVKVVNTQGNPVSGKSVTFTLVSQPNGAIAAAPRSVTKQTGNDGTASATLTLGDKIGDYVVEARCEECTEGSPQTFTGTAVGPEGCTLNGASIASQVHFASGNLFYTQTILSTTGSGPQVNLTLAYNSVDSTAGPLGAHWTHPYAMKIVRDSDNFITLMEEDGYRVVFEGTASGFYAPIDHFGRPGTELEKLSNGSYRLRRKGGTDYLFNPGGLLAQIQDRSGNTLTLHYQGENLTELVDVSGRITRFGYDAQGRLVSVQDPANRITALVYEAGFLTHILDPAGQTTAFSYDAAGRMLRRVDPDRNPVEYTYDDEGRMIQVVDASGVPVTVTYQPEIRQATVTDRESGVTTYIYDPELDVLVQTIAPDGGVTINTYDPERNLLSTTDPAGNTTEYTYEAAGNVLTVTDAAGRITRYTYEPAFNHSCYA